MNSKSVVDFCPNRSRKNLEWILVIISSILLGIWAVKNTIALRNTLLVSGALFAIYYIIQEWRYGELNEQCTLWKVLPILLVGFAFVWVIVHYLFFSIDPVQQFQELKSTWLRAFVASVVGLATGLALRHHPSRLGLLWLGIFVAILILFYQYIPRALAQNKLLIPDYDHYLFHLKVNAVLMGMILMAGIGGTFLDHLRASQHHLSHMRSWHFAYWLVGNSLILWTFVYIVDTRNGIGLSIILYSFWFLCALVFFIQSQIRHQNYKGIYSLVLIGVGLALIMFFVFLQTTINKSWNTLLEDAKIAVKINDYPHWQNPSKMGYPERKDGQMVAANTYERLAWATAGSRAMIAYPQGVGILAHPLSINPYQPPKMIEGAADGIKIATHSGWVELGLAFGLPMLILLLTALVLIFIEATRYPYPAQMTILGFLVLITFLYAVAEVSIKHGLEILFYFLNFLPATLFSRTK